MLFAENVEERQPVLSTPITIPSTATSQRSNPHSNIATPVEEHLAASDEASKLAFKLVIKEFYTNK